MEIFDELWKMRRVHMNIDGAGWMDGRKNKKNIDTPALTY